MNAEVVSLPILHGEIIRLRDCGDYLVRVKGGRIPFVLSPDLPCFMADGALTDRLNPGVKVSPHDKVVFEDTGDVHRGIGVAGRWAKESAFILSKPRVVATPAKEEKPVYRVVKVYYRNGELWGKPVVHIAQTAPELLADRGDLKPIVAGNFRTEFLVEKLEGGSFRPCERL